MKQVISGQGHLPMHSNTRRGLLFLAILLLACGLAGAVFAQRPGVNKGTNDPDIKDSLKQFTTVYGLVEQNYATAVDPEKAIYQGAIPSMLQELDPHSVFLDKKSFTNLHEEQAGKYYGIGMQIGPRNNKIIVLAPFAGTPSYRAGIRPGDVIIAVDGKTTENLTTPDVADMLKGPKGTPVKVTILREGSEKPMEFALVRDEIPRYSVDLHFLIKPGIGYIRVISFQETTEDELSSALDDLGDLQGLILDLRGNPGGLLNEAVGISDKFLKKGATIVSHHGRASMERIYRASHGNGGKDYPIVVLVNRNSASASEIVAGALQDHDRALIVGETTFGKGLVQSSFLLNENTGLLLTTAHYYTPSGRLIQRKYEGLSLYDYYYGRGDSNKKDEQPDPSREVRMTDSGRIVYGGGGINPDVKLDTLKPTHFQDELYLKYVFFNFSKHYLLDHTADKDFKVSESVMQDFRKFLDNEKIAFTEADLTSNSDWLKANIKSEIFIALFGQAEGFRIRAEADPQILRSLELLPQAKELSSGAQKTIAEREHTRQDVIR